MAAPLPAEQFAAVLLPQFEMNVSYLRGLLEDVGDEEFASRPGGAEINTPWWILGHVTYGLGGAIGLCGGDSPLPESFAAFFAGGTEPVPVGEAAEILDKPALLAAFDEAVAEILRALAAADSEALAAPRDTSFAPELPLVRDMVAFLLTDHFAIHSGQLTVWRRLAGRPPRF